MQHTLGIWNIQTYSSLFLKESLVGKTSDQLNKPILLINYITLGKKEILSYK